MGLLWLKADPQERAGIHLPTPQPGAPGLTGYVSARIIGLLQDQARLLTLTINPGTQKPCSADAWGAATLETQPSPGTTCPAPPEPPQAWA